MKIGQNFIDDNWKGTHIRFGDYKLGEIVVDKDKFEEKIEELEEMIEGLMEQNKLYKGWIDVYKNQENSFNLKEIKLKKENKKYVELIEEEYGLPITDII